MALLPSHLPLHIDFFRRIEAAQELWVTYHHPDLINSIAFCRDDIHESSPIDVPVFGSWDCGTTFWNFSRWLLTVALLKYIENFMS